MRIEVEDITAFDNMNGKGVLGTVNFTLDEDEPGIDARVFVKIDCDKDLPLREIEGLMINTAKEKLRKVIE
ncbi:MULTISPECIES: hypothetical protein [unclassified Serratia (in: enterobacteria)]|uniref:hypothetical protein n=1 Tax=unclassified Serratia (in: enterobacteria) TaxID=2647522 RepID=UPI003075FEBC